MPGSSSAPRQRTSSSIPMPARRYGFPRPAISSFAWLTRSSVRCRGSKPSRTGSKPRIGLLFRASRELFLLLVDQRLQHFADHAEMIAVSFELTLEVDEIGGGGVE